MYQVVEQPGTDNPVIAKEFDSFIEAFDYVEEKYNPDDYENGLFHWDSVDIEKDGTNEF